MDFDYKLLKKNIYETILFVLCAVFIGIITGAICALFGRVLIAITGYRELHPLQVIPFLALAGLLIVFIYQKFGSSSNKGMSLIFEAGFEQVDSIPKRMIPIVIFTTWLTHLFGGSAGREGVAVQIGGVIGHHVGKLTKNPNAAKILLLAGMGAGFGGLFQTPIAGVFFAMEVLIVGRVATTAILPAVVAAFMAASTSSYLGLEKFSVLLDISYDLNIIFVCKLAIAGICFGVAGRIFAVSLKELKKLLSKLIVNKYYKIMLVGFLVSVLSLLLFLGRYSGLGTNLISIVFSNGEIFAYDWFLKLLLTIITLAAGFQGGEVTPLFAIGASLGFVLAPILGLNPLLLAALGYAAVFGSATNTLLAPIFIGAEVFGFDYIPLFLIVIAVSYVVNGNRTIYAKQKIDI